MIWFKDIVRDLLVLPRFGTGALPVWKRNFILFRVGSYDFVFWGIFEPLVLLLAFGIGIGSFIPEVNGSSYLKYIFPGVLINTVLMVGFLESAFSATERMKTGQYEAALRARVEPIEVVVGEMLWSISCALVCFLVLAGTGIHFDLMVTDDLLPLLGICVLTALFATGFGLLSGYWLEGRVNTVISAVLVPMSLLSGAYFSITLLPEWLQFAVKLFPHYHSIFLSRLVIDNQSDPNLFLSLSFLFFTSISLLNLAATRVARRLEH